MIFTVFQYVPILEEETPGHRVEMAKKLKQDPTGGNGDDSSDTDCDDDDSEQDVYLTSANQTDAYYNTIKSSFTRSNFSYKFSLQKKHTPPPKA
jgi:hypothetical protein